MQKQTDHAAKSARPSAVRAFGFAAIVLLSALLAAAAFFLIDAYSEGQEIRRFVGGPFGQRLLYLQTCGAEQDAVGGTSERLEAQLSSCGQAASEKAGYSVYDFNTGRSVALSGSDLTRWKGHDVFSFPSSVEGRVGRSVTNPFNRIVPFAEFSGFEYDCEPGEGAGEFICKVAPANCGSDAETIWCAVFNPRTEREEVHVIERDAGLEFLAPQGFITGPDIYKMLKPLFFPSLDR